MSARAIPENLEPEIVSLSAQGWSLRRIAVWLRDTHDVPASHVAVAGVLERHGTPEKVILDEESRRQFLEMLPTTLEELRELCEWYREIVATAMDSDAPKGLRTSLQAAKALQGLVMFKLRACGVAVPRGLVAKAPATIEAPPRAEAAPELAEAQPERAAPPAPIEVPKSISEAAPKPPSRTRPCPCGSGRKYKHCHGAEQPVALAA